MSQDAAIAIAYAVRPPDCVSGLILYGGYAPGRVLRDDAQREEAELLQSLIRVGWGRGTPRSGGRSPCCSCRAGPRAARDFDELARVSASAEVARRLRVARDALDVIDLAPAGAGADAHHARARRARSVRRGSLRATLIPGARFSSLETPNHVLLADEPAWPAFLDEVHAFLGDREAPAVRELPGELSAREEQVLELVALRLSNEQIAGRHTTSFIVLSGLEGTHAVPLDGPAIYDSWKTRPEPPVWAG